MRYTIRQKPALLIELTEAELQRVAGGDSMSLLTVVYNGMTIYQSTNYSETGSSVSVVAVNSSGTSNVSLSTGSSVRFEPISLSAIQFPSFPSFPLDFCAGFRTVCRGARGGVLVLVVMERTYQ